MLLASQVDLIVCWDSAPPSRLRQRSGRTGRHRPGRVVHLLLEGREVDAYYDNKSREAKVAVSGWQCALLTRKLPASGTNMHFGSQDFWVTEVSDTPGKRCCLQLLASVRARRSTFATRPTPLSCAIGLSRCYQKASCLSPRSLTSPERHRRWAESCQATVLKETAELEQQKHLQLC